MKLIAQWALADAVQDGAPPVSRVTLPAQDKDQPKKGEKFNALIRKVDGNKITIIKGDGDRPIVVTPDSMVTLIANEKIKIFAEVAQDQEEEIKIDMLATFVALDDGALRATITTNVSNNITEIRSRPFFRETPQD